MIRSILILLLVVFCQTVFSQGQVYKKVTDISSRQSRTKTYDLFTVSEAPRQARQMPGDTANRLKINEHVLKTIEEETPEYLSFTIPDGDEGLKLELIPKEIYGAGYKVVNSAGQVVKGEKGLHYMGIVNGSKVSLAAISITDAGLSGFVSVGDRNYELGKLSDDPGYVFYNTKVIKKAFECGVKDDYLPAVFREKDFHTDFYLKTAEYVACRAVEIYFEADYSIFQNRGSLQATIDYVNSVFGQVAVMYENEGIEIVISQIKVWDTADPYINENTTNAYLGKFIENINTSFNGDLAHALSARNLGGGIAELDMLCNKGRAVTGNIDFFVGIYPVYSWDVSTIVHELGHNFGSRHTHSCTWPGGAIDNCASVENGSCPAGPAPVNGGTIMSYCHLDENTGINLANGFGPLPGALIRNRARNCMGDAESDCSSTRCYEGGITFRSQAEIDDFGAAYGHCNIIYGNVEISGDDVTNLSPLGNLEEIRGILYVRNTAVLQNFSGFSKLKSITGLMAYSNAQLQDFSGLSALEQVDEFIYAESNPQLKNFNGLSGIRHISGYVIIRQNNALQSLSGLSNLESIGGILNIMLNPQLQNLNGLEGLTEINGNFDLSSNANLQNLNGLQNLKSIGSFDVGFNPKLANFTGLSALEVINGGLFVNGNGELMSFDGMSSALKRIKGRLYIGSNGPLQNLNGLSSLEAIEGALTIMAHNWLTSIAALQNIDASFLEDLVIYNNRILSLCDPPAFLCAYLTTDKPRNISLNGDCPNEAAILPVCIGCPAVSSITFSSQAEIDAFAAYASCEVRLINVTISGADIVNLNGLSGIKSISGDLIIRDNPNLESLSGLSNLEEIGGRLTLSSNAEITDLAGLSNINSVGGEISITANNKLLSNAGLSGISQITGGSLSFINNPVLTDLSGLSGLTAIKNNWGLIIRRNNSLLNLSGLSNLTELTGGITIDENALLQNIDAFSGLNYVRSITITGNAELQNLNGLSNIEGTGGAVDISFNPRIQNLNGLSGLKTLNNGNLLIRNNALLNDISGVAGMAPAAIFNLIITNNTSLPVCHIANICTFLGLEGKLKTISGNTGDCLNLDAVTTACSSAAPATCPTGNLNFTTQTGVDNFGVTYAHCTILPGNVTITGGNITNLNGLSAVQEIKGDVYIYNNNSLPNLNGLSALTAIGGYLFIGTNNALTDFQGLSNLTTIGKQLNISQNSGLINLNGLTKLQSIGGFFQVFDNDALTSLNGLTSLTNVGERISISGNAVLNDISGISGIAPEAINEGLNIFSNPNLSICNLPNICTYLGYDPEEKPRNIINNAGACLNAAAVITACSVLPVECPVNVILTTQAEVEAFVAEYSHCNTITGNVTISGSGKDISNLSGLVFLQHIGGDVNIEYNSLLQNLTGLSGLQTIGGLLNIAANGGLINISELSALQSIGGRFRVAFNDKLQIIESLTALETIGGDAFIGHNPQLQNLHGLTALETIGGELSFWLNPQLQNLDGLSGLHTIGGRLDFYNNASLETLTGLSGVQSVGGELNIYSNQRLQNLNGLQGVSGINGQLFIYNNPELQNLDGLSGLQSIGQRSIRIFDNPQLSSIQGIENIDPNSIEGTGGTFDPGLRIQDNGSLALCNLPNICAYLATDKPRTISGNLGECATEAAVITACSIPPVECPVNITFSAQSQIDDFGITYAHCTTISGNVTIQGSVANLNGLGHLKSIGGDLYIGDATSSSNPSLQNLNGLGALQSIGGWLSLAGLPQLQSLDGLTSLQTLGGPLFITDNPKLQNLDELSDFHNLLDEVYIGYNDILTNVGGLSGLVNIPGRLVLTNNPQLNDISGVSGVQSIGKGLYIYTNPQLEDLNALSGVTSIGDDLQIYDNAQLTSVQGLKNADLSAVSFLRIVNNGALSVCNLPNICAYLATEKNRSISNNLGNCVTEAAVKTACLTPSGTLTLGVGINPTVCGGNDGSIAFTTNLEAGSYTLNFKRGEKDTTATVTVAGGAFTLTALGKGIYSSFSITWQEGTVTATGERTLTDPAAHTFASGTLTHPTGCNGSNGSIAFTTTLPAGTYDISFKKGSKDTTATVTESSGAFTLSGLSAASYSAFSITNAGCSYTLAGPVTLTDPAAHTFAAGSLTHPTTCNGVNGSIAFTTDLVAGMYDVNFKKGTKDTTAKVTVSASAFTITGLSAASYSAFSITSGSCSYTLAGPVTLTAAAGMLTLQEKKDPTVCNATNGSIVFTTNLAAGTYPISFKKGGKDTTVTVTVSAGAFTVSGLSAASYSTFGITNGGCSYTLTGPVELHDPATAGGPITVEGSLELCEGEMVKLTAPQGVSYEWSTGATTQSIWASEGGIYQVKVKSAQGCVSESQITVIKKECNVPPMAVCKPVVVLVAKDDCYAILRVEDLDGGSYDLNNDWYNRSIDINPALRVGSYTATMTLVDIHGASTSCASQVHVVDHSAPVVRARSLKLELNAQGRASISVADIDAGSYDNCGPLELSLNRTEFDCGDLGHHQVILTGRDGSGNISTALADIHVVDNTPPIVIAQGLQITLDENGKATLKAEDLAQSIQDNCGIWGIQASRTEFDCDDIGENTVVLKVEDVQGAVTEAEVTVTVVDNLPPVLQVTPVTVYLDETGKVEITAAEVGSGSTDNCGLESLTLSRREFGCEDIGEHELILTGKDKSGNESEQTVMITVVDTTAPVLVARDVTLYLDASGKATLSTEQVDRGSTDNCGIESRGLQYTVFNCIDSGEHTVEYTVRDKSGNESKKMIKVTVVDSTAPVAQAQDLIVELDGTGKATIKASEINDGSYDNCGITVMSVSQSDFTCSDLGRRLITLTVRDASGNESTARSEVLVRDPEGVCPCSYGVLAEDKIVLKNNEVNAGGIGTSGAKGLVKLRHTAVTQEGTFVRSEQTRFDNESESSVYMRGRAPQAAGFRGNDRKEKKTEKIKKGETRTFAAGSYGKIKGRKEAKLVFSGGDVYIRSMKLKKGSQLSFGGGTVLLVRDGVKLGKETEFNSSGESVRLYSGGDVKISSGSEVKGYVHSRGNLRTTGRREKYLEGFFAADRIKGSRNTHWSGGGLLCRENENEALLAKAKGERRTVVEKQEEMKADSVAEGPGLRVRIWPNTFITRMQVEIAGEAEGGEVLLVDLLGNVLRRESYWGKEKVLEMSTEKLEVGMYVLRVSSGGQVRTLRVLKNEK